MKDLLPQIQDWNQAGKTFAVATVVDTWRSAPRMPGSTMIISDQHEIAGSVSGGCIEGAVIQQAQETLATGKAKLMTFGVSNEDAWQVGLSCGGKIKVFVESFLGNNQQSGQDEIWQQLVALLSADEGCALIHRLAETAEKVLVARNGRTWGSASQMLSVLAMEQLADRKSGMAIDDGVDYFIQVFPRRNHLIIIGAAHLTVDLIDLAHSLDYKTTVIDPRGIFTDSLKRICEPSSLIKAWPEEVLAEMTLDEHVYAVTLSHDPKIDDPALAILLRSKVKYIGALGSRKTHERRVKRLSDRGFSDDEISRIHAPVGVSIGAMTPREIALSIAAELTQVRRLQAV